MGLATTSTTHTNSNFIEGEKYWLECRGKDYEGISEFFQYHDEQIREKQFQLSNSDKFFRQGFGPMHMMDFQFFNNLLNDFVSWCEKQEFFRGNDW